jgi:ATP/maltotriose-dependent transcriptional regulator MalT
VTKKGKTRLEPLTDEQKQDRRDNWLAPTGSQQEKQFLKRWAQREGLSEANRALIKEWHNTPDGFEKRNTGFSRAAKKSVLGDVVWEAAMERHKKLPRGREWEVACLTAEGYEQEEIADLMDRSPRTIDGIILDIKRIIVQDLNCEMESVNIAQIALWFRGL